MIVSVLIILTSVLALFSVGGFGFNYNISLINYSLEPTNPFPKCIYKSAIIPLND